jgi:uncharacterized phage protein gp47/JayE
MTTVDSTGFLRTRLDERVAQLVADYQAIYGDDIQVNPDDIDGQFLGILAERISDLDQLAEDVYNALNPQLATGVGLSRLVQLNGIRRQAGAYSTATVTLGGTAGTLIPAGSLVQSPANTNMWQTVADATIASTGTATVGVRCTVFGAIAAASGALTKISSPLFGWQTVTNASAATLGRSEETDEDLRIRRRASTNTPGQCILDALYGALANLPGVVAARVYENYSDAIDSNGLSAHSIYCVVDGGDDAQIANLIWVKKTAGTTLIGSSVQTVTDSQGQPHDVRYARPADVNVYIAVSVTKRPGYPTAGAVAIKNAIVAYGLTLAIGDPLLDTRLYTPVNTVPNHYINSIYIGTSPGPVSGSNIAVAFDARIRIDASRITVTEV